MLSPHLHTRSWRGDIPGHVLGLSANNMNIWKAIIIAFLVLRSSWWKLFWSRGHTFLNFFILPRRCLRLLCSVLMKGLQKKTLQLHLSQLSTVLLGCTCIAEKVRSRAEITVVPIPMLPTEASFELGSSKEHPMKTAISLRIFDGQRMNPSLWHSPDTHTAVELPGIHEVQTNLISIMHKQSPPATSPELSTTISRGAFELCTLSHPVHLQNLAAMTVNQELKSASQCHKNALKTIHKHPNLDSSIYLWPR